MNKYPFNYISINNKMIKDFKNFNNLKKKEIRWKIY